MILPLVIFAVLAIIQVGLLVRDHLAVRARRARGGARGERRSRSVERGRTPRTERCRTPTSTSSPRPSVGQPITVEVRYRAVTDVPLVGVLFPDPVLHSRAVMRVEK